MSEYIFMNPNFLILFHGYYCPFPLQHLCCINITNICWYILPSRRFTVSLFIFRSLFHLANQLFLWWKVLSRFFFCFNAWISSDQRHWLEWPFCDIIFDTKCLHMCRPVSGLTVVFHQSICLSLNKTTLSQLMQLYKKSISIKKVLYFFFCL